MPEEFQLHVCNHKKLDELCLAVQSTSTASAFYTCSGLGTLAVCLNYHALLVRVALRRHSNATFVYVQ